MWAGVIPICGTKVVTIVTNMTLSTFVTNEGKCHDLTSPFLRRALAKRDKKLRQFRETRDRYKMASAVLEIAERFLLEYGCWKPDWSINGNKMAT